MEPNIHRNPVPPVSRREALHRIGAGMGSLGLAGMLQQAGAKDGPSSSPLAPNAPHYSPKEKHVIPLFMQGCPSQV